MNLNSIWKAKNQAITPLSRQVSLVRPLHVHLPQFLRKSHDIYPVSHCSSASEPPCLSNWPANHTTKSLHLPKEPPWLSNGPVILKWVISLHLSHLSKEPVSYSLHLPNEYHIIQMSHTKVSLWSTTSYHIRVPMSHSLHNVPYPVAHLFVELTNEPSSTKRKTISPQSMCSVNIPQDTLCILRQIRPIF